MKNKLKTLGALLALTILPVIGNLIMICLFPVLFIFVLFSAKSIKTKKLLVAFKNSIATFNTKELC